MRQLYNMCMTNTEELLKRIKEIRDQKKIKQQDLAEILKIDRTTYLRKEHGQIPITAEELLLISKAFSEEPALLFMPSGSEESPIPANREEIDLLRIYRALNDEERRDFIFSIRLILKGVDSKEVQEGLKGLTQP